MIRKRILIITDYFHPHWTGISKSLAYIIPHLTKRADVTVLTTKHENGLADSELYEGASVIRVPYQWEISRSKYSLIKIFKAIPLMLNVDTVFLNSPSANMLPFSFLTKFLGKKLLVFHQGDIVLPKGIKNKMIEMFFNLSFLTSCILADRVATYTMDYARNSRLLKYFLKKTTGIIIPIPQKSNLRKCKNGFLNKIQDKKHVYIGFAGRFVEEKGFDLLLESIPAIHKKFPHVVFMYAGQSHVSYEHFFEKNRRQLDSLKDCLVFLGLLNDTCMQMFYHVIDLLIVPSRSDCFNLVQAEAMLRKVPAIVSDIPGARYLVQKTKFGYLFKSEDKKDLEEKITTALLSKDLLQKQYPKVLQVLNEKRNADLMLNFILT